jgi:hypothetical protein
MLTYCTNVHPGEAWADVRENLEAHTRAVKAAFAPDALFPLGLRVSGRAAEELDPGESLRFRDWCEANDCFVLSLNGFPHGRFHGAGVKEKVYLPDWRDPARSAYTRRLADLLADWLPGGVVGSISSVPVAFRPGFREEDWPAVRRHLLETLEHLERIRQERGIEILLALEPEPGCVLESTADALACFERLQLPPPLAELAGLCFDCCHQAVEFERPADCLAALDAAGIRIAKLQVSSALRARGDEIRELMRFDEPAYLHQAVARTRGGELRHFADLPDLAAALHAGEGDELEECRVHFHVPIFADRLGHCGTTRFFLEEMLPIVGDEIPLEVETYSFNVLPPELRDETVAESVIRELRWAKRQR